MTIFTLPSQSLEDEWLDVYGHMNMGYYLVPVGKAVWTFMDNLGIGVEYFERTGCAFYTLESHIRYLREVRSPALLEIEGVVLESDAKRWRYALTMKVEGVERATFECIDLHFDTRAGRPAPMPEEIQDTLRDAAVGELPEWAGRGISLSGKGK